MKSVLTISEMRKPTDEEPEDVRLPTWGTGTITIVPAHGIPKQVHFPCTRENQLVFQRLEQEQAAIRQLKRDN